MTLYMEETIAKLLKEQNIDFSDSELDMVTRQVNSKLEAINNASHMQTMKK